MPRAGAGPDGISTRSKIARIRWQGAFTAALCATPTRTQRVGFVTCSLGVVMALVLSRLWVAEDAYITFRTLDNFVNGYGLRWNVDERVQTFTHPLWALIQIPLYAVTRSTIATTTAVSLAASLGALILLHARFARNGAALLLGVTLPLAMSETFLWFSTSGFENPLSHFWVVLFASRFLARPEPGSRSVSNDEIPWFSLFGVAALATVTRFDTALVYAPALIGLIASSRTRGKRVRFTHCALGLAPLLLWVVFSLFYYGFILPNTAPAKLSSHLPVGDYFAHGIDYAGNLLFTDPYTFLLIIVGLAIAVGAARRSLVRGEEADLRIALLGLGALLYCVYVMRVGGDFIGGRFWSLPFVVCTVLWATWLERTAAYPAGITPVRLALVGLVGLMLPVAVALYAAPERETRVDEPAFGVHRLPLAYVRLAADFTWRMSPAARQFEMIGRSFRAAGEQAIGKEEQYVAVAASIGMAGMAAGPGVTLIDRHALGDPLLSRLPPANRDIGVVGHIERTIPEGYEEARRTGSLVAMHPALRAYYIPLRRIVSAPLFDAKRLRTLVEFQLGRYDRHLESYTAMVLDEREDSGAANGN